MGLSLDMEKLSYICTVVLCFDVVSKLGVGSFRSQLILGQETAEPMKGFPNRKAFFVYANRSILWKTTLPY